MNPILKNIIVVILSMFAGGTLNSLIVKFGPKIFPLPEGVDPSNLESIAANIHRYDTGNFMTVFFAHALGTFVASFLIARFAASQHRRLALIPGFFFLIGGIMMTRMLDAPTWFDALDLLVAYLPMAFLGYLLGRKK